MGTLIILLSVMCATSSSLQAQSSGQQRRAARKEKRIQNALTKLEKAKEQYAKKQVQLVDAMGKTYQSTIHAVNASSWPIDVRTRISKELEEAKQAFTDDGTLEKIPAFQGTYVAYIASSLKAYSRLMIAYEKAAKAIPNDDPRAEALREELLEQGDRIEAIDTLQVGTVWKGFRSDHDWGPGLKVTKGEDAVWRLTKFHNGRVDVSFELEITDRKGTYVAGLVSQNNKRFVAVVEGDFDGVNLMLKMTRMVKGQKRYFEYAGTIAGHLGELNLRGRKTNGATTTGNIVLEFTED